MSNPPRGLNSPMSVMTGFGVPLLSSEEPYMVELLSRNLLLVDSSVTDHHEISPFYCYLRTVARRRSHLLNGSFVPAVRKRQNVKA